MRDAFGLLLIACIWTTVIVAVQEYSTGRKTQPNWWVVYGGIIAFFGVYVITRL